MAISQGSCLGWASTRMTLQLSNLGLGGTFMGCATVATLNNQGYTCCVFRTCRCEQAASCQGSIELYRQPLGQVPLRNCTSRRAPACSCTANKISLLASWYHQTVGATSIGVPHFLSISRKIKEPVMSSYYRLLPEFAPSDRRSASSTLKPWAIMKHVPANGLYQDSGFLSHSPDRQQCRNFADFIVGQRRLNADSNTSHTEETTSDQELSDDHQICVLPLP
jgi:hypothetical protein